MTSTKICTVQSIAELRQAIRELRRDKPKVGLVPTMGALHKGHLSLVEKSTNQCDATIVSIFVNPTQFAPNEDLSQYPRPLDRDLQLLAEAGVDLVFIPGVEDVYPEGCTASVNPPAVARKLEGESRPTHFAGVATVVLKLFHMTGADVAYFGQKDHQQSQVVKHMVRDLNVPIEIVVCPTVRDDDGLALSSRNAYLSDEERVVALSLHRTLCETARMIEQGENDGRAIMAFMTQALIEGGVTETDYATIVDAETLAPLETVILPAALLVAARIGKTRLIDNRIIV